METADDPEDVNSRFAQARAETRRVAGETERKAKVAADIVDKKAEKLRKEIEEKAKVLHADATDLKKKVERKGREVEKDLKKTGKKIEKGAKEFEREARKTAKKYPVAATGLVGLVNVAVLATVGLAAYQNWDQPRWDRRTVSLTTVGLLGLFGAQGFLGYYEYEKDEEERKLPRA